MQQITWRTRRDEDDSQRIAEFVTQTRIQPSKSSTTGGSSAIGFATFNTVDHRYALVVCASLRRSLLTLSVADASVVVGNWLEVTCVANCMPGDTAI